MLQHLPHNIYSQHLHEERYITLQHLPHKIYSHHLHEERYVTRSPPYWAVERLSMQLQYSR